MRTRVGFNEPKNLENCGLIRFHNDETVHIINFKAFFEVKDEIKSKGAKKIPNFNLYFMLI